MIVSLTAVQKEHLLFGINMGNIGIKPGILALAADGMVYVGAPAVVGCAVGVLAGDAGGAVAETKTTNTKFQNGT